MNIKQMVSVMKAKFLNGILKNLRSNGVRNGLKNASDLLTKFGINPSTKPWRLKQSIERIVSVEIAKVERAKALDFPWWQWIHNSKEHPRLHHKALHLKVFPGGTNFPYPPIGYGCKCRIIGLTDDQVKGLEISDPPTLDDLLDKSGWRFNPNFQEPIPETLEEFLEQLFKDLHWSIAEKLKDLF